MNRRDFLVAAGAAVIAPRPGFGQAGPKPPSLRFRQIHLDFHTSEAVRDIGAQFDPEEFVRTLVKARVNSITCFARCHHGWIYYDTKAHPERRHPYLKRNLLPEQIEICHKHDIRVPIYVTVQWDHYTSTRHPEWLVIDEKGTPVGTPLYEPGFYRRLCVNSPYRQFLAEHVTEILKMMPVDGFFFDITHPMSCNCYYCRELMRKKGMNPADAAARQRFGLETINAWKREMTALVRRYSKDATIFYNAGHIGPRHRPVMDAYTHWELESLPSGGWGYLDFPLKVRYTRTLGLDSLGMTGKFHTSWGDFHSLKNRAALEFECFQMLALGARCSVGDQLHPSGKIDAATHDLIGAVYQQVEKKEPWCRNARSVADVGMLTPEEFWTGQSQRIPMPAFGGVRLLQEAAVQFDVLDSKSDFAKYKVLILPDQIPVNDDLARKIEAFLAKGGSLLASWESGLDPQGKGFRIGALGLKYEGEAPYSPDFLVPQGKLAEGLPKTELVMYRKGKKVAPLAGTEVLAQTNVPYFNRTWEHFFSHRHTPSAGKPGYPGVLRTGRCIYFIHPVFTQYQQNAPLWVKRLVVNALGMLLTDPVLRLRAPSSTLASLMAQEKENRWVLHLLHYIPERRGQDFDVIEDVIPIFDVGVSVNAPRAVREVLCVPEMRRLEFKTAAGRVEFVLPRLEGHQMIALQFG
jgi:hypothetical protein